MPSLLIRFNKFIYGSLFHIDLDLQSNFLEQFISFQYNQRNKKLISILLAFYLINTLIRVVSTSDYTKNAYLNLNNNKESKSIIMILYILFILNFLIILTFFVLFGITTSYLQLKLTTSGLKTYIHDGLLTCHTLIICIILILKIINGNCSNEMFCNPSFLIGISLSPIFLPILFCGVQFNTILLNWFITFISMIIANTLFEWTPKSVFVTMAYIIFCLSCIFQIHKLELKHFILMKKLSFKFYSKNDYDDLENSFEQENSNSMNKKSLSTIKFEVLANDIDGEYISDIPSTDDKSNSTLDNNNNNYSYPIIESKRNLNDFLIFYQFYEQEFLITLYEFKSGRISDTSSIWKLFPHLALPKLFINDKDREGYGLKSLPEATNFLLDLTLGPKFILLLNTILDKINDDEMKIQELLGSMNNAMILLSCTTLFFYSSFGTSYNRIFEILMRKCREELHINDSETQLFCSESANCYR